MSNKYVEYKVTKSSIKLDIRIKKLAKDIRNINFKIAILKYKKAKIQKELDDNIYN